MPDTARPFAFTMLLRPPRRPWSWRPAVLGWCLSFVLLGCQQAPSPAASGRARFGAAIPEIDGDALQTVLESPAAFNGRTVVVTGRVQKACSRRGCWMELAASAEEGAARCRVTFKDYGFFVPLDAAGSEARVHGEVKVRTIPKDEVDHLESEGAHFASKNPDGTAQEVHLVAAGVELWREDSKSPG